MRHARQARRRFERADRPRARVGHTHKLRYSHHDSHVCRGPWLAAGDSDAQRQCRCLAWRLRLVWCYRLVWQLWRTWSSERRRRWARRSRGLALGSWSIDTHSHKITMAINGNHAWNMDMNPGVDGGSWRGRRQRSTENRSEFTTLGDVYTIYTLLFVYTINQYRPRPAAGAPTMSQTAPLVDTSERGDRF